MTNWEATCELRRYDNTSKLTQPRLQQQWRRAKIDGWGYLDGHDYEWRDVPLVWERPELDNWGKRVDGELTPKDEA